MTQGSNTGILTSSKNSSTWAAFNNTGRAPGERAKRNLPEIGTQSTVQSLTKSIARNRVSNVRTPNLRALPRQFDMPDEIVDRSPPFFAMVLILQLNSTPSLRSPYTTLRSPDSNATLLKYFTKCYSLFVIALNLKLCPQFFSSSAQYCTQPWSKGDRRPHSTDQELSFPRQGLPLQLLGNQISGAQSVSRGQLLCVRCVWRRNGTFKALGLQRIWRPNPLSPRPSVGPLVQWSEILFNEHVWGVVVSMLSLILNLL